jgi:hypothetical protein
LKTNSNRHHLALIGTLTVMLCFASLVSATAQENAQRVRFQRGQSSTTMKGMIAGFDTKDYVISAKANQQMTLHLSSPNPSTYFVIQSINGRATDMNETAEWSERISESGDYVISVFTTVKKEAGPKAPCPSDRQLRAKPLPPVRVRPLPPETTCDCASMSFPSTSAPRLPLRTVPCLSARPRTRAQRHLWDLRGNVVDRRANAMLETNLFDAKRRFLIVIKVADEFDILSEQ